MVNQISIQLKEHQVKPIANALLKDELLLNREIGSDNHIERTFGMSLYFFPDYLDGDDPLYKKIRYSLNEYKNREVSNSEVFKILLTRLKNHLNSINNYDDIVTAYKESKNDFIYVNGYYSTNKDCWNFSTYYLTNVNDIKERLRDFGLI